MNIDKFKLLMWKNYCLRRYHRIATLIEFFLPILMAVLIVKVTSSLKGKTADGKINATIYSPTSKSDFLLHVKFIPICYAPRNFATDNFMDQIRIRFHSVVGFTNETEFISALNDSLRIGIFFKNISNESLPDRLNYSLRNTNKWETKILYPTLNSRGPYVEHPYFFTSFAAVQLLINENFIKLKTNQTLPEKLEFEWFPYPEYTRSAGARTFIAGVLSSLVIFIVLIVSVPLINDIIEEKESGVKELMKISGLGEWMMWFNWFIHAFIISFISFTILTIILTYPFHGVGSEAIHSVQFSVLWILVILYCVANISFCFMFSTIFHKPGTVSSIFLIVFGVLYFGIEWLITNAANSQFLKLVTLTPVGAFLLGAHNIRYYEEQGIEFTWTSAGVSENEKNAVSLTFCLIMLIIDTFLYFILALYISAVNPGKFGVRKSPLFIFQSLFSFNGSTSPLENSVEELVENEFIEPAPANLEPTIQIKDLHKQYRQVYAVRGVNLNIYPDEMTALLGHNGAGKTTTMSIMTGLTSPSAGSIYYKNVDIFENMESFRENLGFCPQENRTMPYLTVVEHLEFFGQLKGSSPEEAEAEADEYLNMMEMQPKRNARVEELSGGMKRKLCLSIALMGKAKVLILDEPTSGMDVQSRRKLWDLLLDMRGERTIIFTTHYMEEADALGDRIAIMNHGVIVCHGTPIFLKKAYGTGYELTITRDQYGSSGIDRTIKNVMPNASREFETANEVVYKLPLTETDKFPTLFKNLESKMSQLGIEHMGVAATTMEHVFLKAGDVSPHDEKSIRNTDTDSDDELEDFTYAEGVSLFFQQIMAIFKKKYLYTTRNPLNIFNRIILPTLVGLFFLSLLNELDLSPEPALDLSLSTYPAPTVVLRNNLGYSDFEKHLSEYVAEKKALLVKAEDTPIEKELLKHAKDILKYNKNYISAFELNSTMTKILSNPMLIHSLPITITTYSNVVLRQLANNRQYGIETLNHPVQKSGNSTNLNPIGMCGVSQMQSLIIVMWILALAFYTVDLVSYFSYFVNMERIDGFKHIQMISHVSPFVYWFSTLVFDLMVFLIATGARVILYKFTESSNVFGLNTSLQAFAVIAVLYGISGLLFVYITGYLSKSKEGSYTLLFIFDLIYSIIATIVYGIEKFRFQQNLDLFSKIIYYIVKTLTLLIPSLNFLILFIKFLMISNSNTACTRCPEELKPQCEALFKTRSYFEFASTENMDGMLLEIIFLLVDIVLYSVILAFINMGYVGYWFNSLIKSIYGTDSTNNDQGDYDVQQEYKKVQQLKEPESNVNNVALLVDGLRKNFISWFKPFTAVSDVSFIVKPGECFGLLGVNGAGKSTTFKMLTAEILPTLGDSSIENVKLSKNKTKYLSMAGYCPQSDCFIEELTGREMLSMIAAMRGVSRNKNEAVVNAWINIIGLEEFQYHRCGSYSGGNKRKVCTAMSLIGDPRVVFLDEPTSGVDPVSRRKLYDVMAQTKAAGQAVILTSHSMEECETLCDRLTIMVSGVMKCIGTTQHLKKIYAQGFSVLIRIADIPDEIENFKQNMSLAFNPEHTILKDEHMGLLYYQITDTSLPWSMRFEKMEALKNHHKELVEDYVLTDTTLEEVFISFAKEGSSYSSKL